MVEWKFNRSTNTVFIKFLQLRDSIKHTFLFHHYTTVTFTRIDTTNIYIIEIKSVTAFFRFARKRQSWSIIGQIFVERYIHQTKQRLAFNVDLSRCSTYRSNISSPLQRLIAWTSIVHPSNVSRHVSSGQDLRFSLSINFACTFARLSRKLANIASVAIRFVADRSSFSRRNGVSLPSPPTRRRFRHVAQLRWMTEGKQKIFQIKHSGQIDTRGQDERNDLQRNDSRKKA